MSRTRRPPPDRAELARVTTDLEDRLAADGMRPASRPLRNLAMKTVPALRGTVGAIVTKAFHVIRAIEQER